MSLHLITGYGGSEHITSADDGSFNAAMYGTGSYVLDRGNKFSASATSNNNVRILDGDIIMQGRHIRLKENSYEDVPIDNGTAGVKRHDIIAARYEKNAETGIETCSFVVIKGTPAATASDPACTSGNILNGDAINDMPLYRVKINGIALEAVERLFATKNAFSAEGHTHTKSQITDFAHTHTKSQITDFAHTHTKSQITDFPTSLPANGGNADTVDGFHASEIMADLTTNLLKPTLQTTTVSGVTIENLGDGTYRLNGTATENAIFYVLSSQDTVALLNANIGKALRLVGCSESTYGFSIWSNVTGEKVENGGGVTFTCNSKVTSANCVVGCASGATFSNVIFKPMLTTNLSATYDDFVPYTGDTGKLNGDVALIQNTKADGTTNLLNPTLQTVTKNGVTFTNNGDGTYTLNGTASSAMELYLLRNADITSPSGLLKLVGCPSGNNGSKYSLKTCNGGEWKRYDSGNGSIVYSPVTYVVIGIQTGTVCDNLVFKPMLTTNLSATYDDFVAYTGDTGKLNSDVAELQNTKAAASHTHTKSQITNFGNGVAIQSSAPSDTSVLWVQ